MTETLSEKLKEYGKEDYYPFHMPGHKGNPLFLDSSLLQPSMDITEIYGFDNLHHPEGIILKAQQRLAQLYNVRESFFCVNGSTGALLAAISAATPRNGKILIARNCHKAVYHAAYLRNLEVIYTYPQWNEKYGLNGGICPKDVDNLLELHKDVKTVVITSPSYDGMVSDVKKIAEAVHRHKGILIVDEAHGAHFRFSEYFPVPAEELGADLIVQSFHKTLPSLTQTAVLHVNSTRVDTEILKRFLGIYQSSSPSYLMMASLDSCTTLMRDKGRKLFQQYTELLEKTRKELGKFQNLYLAGENLKGRYSVYDKDASKLILSVRGSEITGEEIQRKLRMDYHLQMEMATEDYILALSSVADTEEGMKRLIQAVSQLDHWIEKKGKSRSFSRKSMSTHPVRLKARMKIAEAMEGLSERIPLRESQGYISAEFAYLYPPGIPLVVPGEEISIPWIENIRTYQGMGLEIQGLSDYQGLTIRTVKEK